LVRVRPWLGREHDYASGGEVDVAAVERLVVVWSEVVADLAAGGTARELEQRVAVVAAARVLVEGAVAGREEQVAAAVGGDPVTAHPYPAALRVRGGVERPVLVERRGVVRQDPTVVRRVEAVVGEGDVHLAPHLQQGPPLILGDVVERDRAVDRVNPRSGHLWFDHDRSAELLGTG